MAATDAEPTPPTGKAPDPEGPIKRAEYASAEELAGFLTDLGSTGEIKLELFRKSPPTFQGIKIDGHLRNYSEPFTIEEISEEHGGGKFQVRCQKRNATTGRWQYAGARTFDVAGVAKIDALRGPDSGNGKSGASDPAVGQALNMAATVMTNSQAEAAALRAEAREGNRGGMDEGTRLMIDGMNTQLSELRTAMGAKDDKIMELIGKKPDTSGQDRLFDVLDKSTEDHSSRINEIRMAHDSELRSMRESSRDEVKRREDRFEKELDAVRAGHIREVDSLKDGHRVAMDAQKTALEMRIDTLKEQMKRGERDLVKLEAEVGTLRGKKDLSPMDQLQTIVTLKNGLEAVFPTADDEPSRLEKIVGAIAESPIVASLAARIEGGGPGPAPGQPQLAPGDHMVKVRDAKGEVHDVPASYVRKMQEQQAERQAAVEKDPVSALDPAELKQAVAFLETAYGNGHPPEMVAATARSLVPGDILSFLKKSGVDEFLKQVGISDNSPLATIAGRQWVRGVAEVLLQGYVDTTKTAAPAAEDAPPTDDGEFDVNAAVDDVDAGDDPAVD